MDPLPEEKQWIKRFQAGDAAAFAKIMGHYEPYALGLVWRMTGDRHAAEDICQEVFIKVLKGLGRFRTESSLKTWIFRIAHNAALDHKRSHRPMESLADRDEIVAGGDAGRDGQPLARMEDAQLKKAIERAMETLPALPREVLHLFYWDELSVAEIGTVLEIPEGTVKTHLFRGRKTLREQMLQSKLGGAL
jgi:RNA polymerase sigma-70 factor (ECF subfamily)